MNEINTWEELRKAQRQMLVNAVLAALTSAFFFLQGGVAAGVIIGLVGLLFLGMGIFPRTSEEHPMTRRWIIGFTLLLFGVIATLSYFE